MAVFAAATSAGADAKAASHKSTTALLFRLASGSCFHDERKIADALNGEQIAARNRTFTTLDDLGVFLLGMSNTQPDDTIFQGTCAGSRG